VRKRKREMQMILEAKKKVMRVKRQPNSDHRRIYPMVTDPTTMIVNVPSLGKRDV